MKRTSPPSSPRLNSSSRSNERHLDVETSVASVQELPFSTPHLPINGFMSETIRFRGQEATLKCAIPSTPFDVTRNSTTSRFLRKDYFSFMDPSTKGRFLSQLHQALEDNAVWSGTGVFSNFWQQNGKSIFGWPSFRLQKVISSTTRLTGESSGQDDQAIGSYMENTHIPLIPYLQAYPLVQPCLQLMVIALQKAMGESFKIDTVTLVWFNPTQSSFDRQAFHTDWQRPKVYCDHLHKVAVMMSCSDRFKLHFLPKFSGPTPQLPIPTSTLLQQYGPIEEETCGFGGIVGCVTALLLLRFFF